jgi:hypothetical protein
MVDRLAAEVDSFNDAQRRGLAVDKSASLRQLCLGLGLPTGGDGYVKFTQSINELLKRDWVHKDSHGLGMSIGKPPTVMTEKTPSPVYSGGPYRVSSCG